MRKLTSQEKKAVYDAVFKATYSMYVRIDNRKEEEITPEVIKNARDAAYREYYEFSEFMHNAYQRDIISEETLNAVTDVVIGTLLKIFDRLSNKESADDSLAETQIVLDMFGYLE